MRHATWKLATTLGAAALAAGQSTAQPLDCRQTPEGRVCRVQEAIIAGAEVSEEEQRQLGLVTVSDGCSGTMLNRFWLLTARHCVTVGATVAGPLLPASSVTITATWQPGRVGVASRIVDFAVNRPSPGRDIVLVYFGAADLGETPEQRIYAVARAGEGNSTVLSGRLREQDDVVQYGRGYSTYASGVWGGNPPPTPAGGLGIYRKAGFRPTAISNDGYRLPMNASSQVGAGGDSGGPTWVLVNGVLSGIAGVQSACNGTYLPGAPSRWRWATGISGCTYVSTEPFWREILQAIKERPACAAAPQHCGIAPISRVVLGE